MESFFWWKFLVNVHGKGSEMVAVSGISWSNPVEMFRRMWFFPLEQGEPSAMRVGVPCCQGICSCGGITEFSGGKSIRNRELHDAGMDSVSPEDVCIRVEDIQHCLRLLGHLPENEARALLAYYSGDRRKFARLTGINNKDRAAAYVAGLVETLASEEKGMRFQ
jgi:hypothetical protein